MSSRRRRRSSNSEDDETITFFIKLGAYCLPGVLLVYWLRPEAGWLPWTLIVMSIAVFLWSLRRLFKNYYGIGEHWGTPRAWTWIGGFIFLTLALGLALQHHDDQQANQWKIWINEPGFYFKTSWHDRKLQYVIDRQCAGFECDDILIDFLDDKNEIIDSLGIKGSKLLRGHGDALRSVKRDVQLKARATKVLNLSPEDASECRDGWMSPSTGRGTCSHHGGVKRTLSRYFIDN